jgi:hypothetical protein
MGRRQARRRAEALLWAWLSPAQRKQYRARRWFDVTAASGRRYRVLRGAVVRLHPRGSGYCIEATSPVPVADEMLANKLLLETNERRFLATAHRFPYRSLYPSDLGLWTLVGRATGLTTAGSLRAGTISQAGNVSASTGCRSDRLTSTPDGPQRRAETRVVTAVGRPLLAEEVKGPRQ